MLRESIEDEFDFSDAACPHCGSTAATILRLPRPGWFGTGSAVCDFCGRLFGLRIVEDPPEARKPP